MISRESLELIHKELFTLGNFPLCDPALDPSGKQSLERHVLFQRALAEVWEELQSQPAEIEEGAPEI